MKYGNISDRYTVLIDAGHGNLDAQGKYTTAPTDGKFFDHKDKALNIHDIEGNSVFYEGVHNRVMARALRAHLNSFGIQSIFLHDEIEDTPRPTRIRRANSIWQALEKRAILVSLHCDAGKGDGWSYYTSVSKTQSDLIGKSIAESVAPHLQANGVPMRGGVAGKEKNFDMVAKTACPSVLIEHEFFDTARGLARLRDSVYMNKLLYLEAAGLYNAINTNSL